MKLIAQTLTLPGGAKNFSATGPLGSSPQVAGKPLTNLGSLISAGLEVVAYLAFFLLFVWMAWGVFQYIFSGGNKENLARARKRITWAIIGFLVIIMAFTLSRFLGEILSPATPAGQFNP